MKPPRRTWFSWRWANAVAISVAIATVVFFVAWMLRDTVLFGNPAEESRDIALALRADAVTPRNLKAPIVFFAIDAAAARALGHSDRTPHDRLANLLLHVAEAHPALIVVDLDIAWPSPAAEDRALDGVLDRLGQANTRLLLVREPSAADPTAMGPYALAPSPFDATVARHPSIQWVAANPPADEIATVRHLLSWVPVCRGSRPAYLPGVGLAAARQYATSLGMPSGAGELFAPPDWSCAPRTARAMGEIGLNTPIVAGGETIATVHPLEAIRYTLKWRGVPSLSSQTVTDRDGVSRNLYAVFPALPYMNAALPASDNLRGWVRNGIVVIGATYAETRDLRDTPLGEMPGSFVVVNALRGMLDFGPEREAPWWSGLLVTIAISLVTVFATIALERYFSTWLEWLLPVAITAVWWLVLTVTSGGGGYFALALTQLIVGLVLRLVPRDAGEPGHEGAR